MIGFGPLRKAVILVVAVAVDIYLDPSYYSSVGVTATSATPVTWSNVKDQIRKDAEVIDSGRQVVWIFVASERTGIGPTQQVLNALKLAGVQFEIHWPA